MIPTLQDPRAVRPEDFPAREGPDQKLKFLLNYAVLAPSVHNTQPWRFRVDGDELALFADRTRALPVVDPEDRQLIMSCGAALFHLRVALARFGLSAAVKTFPDFNDPDLLAYVRIEPHEFENGEIRMLFDAIKERRTNRFPYEQRDIPPAEWDVIHGAAESENAWFTSCGNLECRIELAQLVIEAGMRQAGDKAFRRELASWIHPSRARSKDGLPDYGSSQRNLDDNAAFVVRMLDAGNGHPATVDEMVSGSPTIAVLSTQGDNAASWLTAGQAVDKVLLTACSRGIRASFLNQPIELSDLRERVSEIVGAPGRAQAIIRLGYADRVRPTLRRPVHDVLYQRS